MGVVHDPFPRDPIDTNSAKESKWLACTILTSLSGQAQNRLPPEAAHRSAAAEVLGYGHEYPFHARSGIVSESPSQGISGTGIFGRPEGEVSSRRCPA